VDKDNLYLEDIMRCDGCQNLDSKLQNLNPKPFEQDPDRWVINEKTGAIEERLHAVESTLTSPRGGKQAAMFAQCLGMLFHQVADF
jgi:hypothetical protein